MTSKNFSSTKLTNLLTLAERRDSKLVVITPTGEYAPNQHSSRHDSKFISLDQGGQLAYSDVIGYRLESKTDEEKQDTADKSKNGLYSDMTLMGGFLGQSHFDSVDTSTALRAELTAVMEGKKDKAEFKADREDLRKQSRSTAARNDSSVPPERQKLIDDLLDSILNRKH